ncbi:hypothetical protein [Spirosoma utsteinense]|uniref:Transposase n=1 Tax=Spirosoma utsteinense TaxID=2585773 RepID=A0ABR6VZ82_9BACT|nr:hypothetical protein [Spirosoma utsteinense]MBC3784610.1 hypothetical protein [Spirosoma utsteinense]MBC3789637.1 hypothetical protein [Spirosoma utsteinense]
MHTVRTEPLATNLTFVDSTEWRNQAGLPENQDRKLAKSARIRRVGSPGKNAIRTYWQEALILIMYRSAK